MSEDTHLHTCKLSDTSKATQTASTASQTASKATQTTCPPKWSARVGRAAHAPQGNRVDTHTCSASTSSSQHAHQKQQQLVVPACPRRPKRDFSQYIRVIYRHTRPASATRRALRQGCITTSQQTTGSMPAKDLQRAVSHVKAGICGKALGNRRVQRRCWRTCVKAACRMPA